MPGLCQSTFHLRQNLFRSANGVRSDVGKRISHVQNGESHATGASWNS